MKRNNKFTFDIIGSNETLKKMFRWYMDYNSSLSAPYHNLNHTLGMMQLVIDFTLKSRQRDYGFRIDDEGMFILLVSALFHDFNHTAGRFDDSVNIHHALTGLRDCVSTLEMTEPEKEKLVSVCSEIIRATEYPYIMDDSELTLYQRIIREFDILVVMYDDFVSQCLFGLIEEMRLKNHLMSLSKYTKFLLDAFSEMKLKYSVELFEEHKESFLKQIESFFVLLK